MKLPTGNVTLLFAEVDRGSAPLGSVSDIHLADSSLRQALLYVLHAQNGSILSMEDDSLRVGFSTPEEALTVAVALQQIFHPDRADIPAESRSAVRRFRVALHNGRAQVNDGAYIGPTVDHTNQLLTAGYSGQILVSAECAHALQHRCPTGVRLLNLGKCYYPGQAEDEAIFQVLHADLPAEFPPLRMAGASATNLPIPATAFVGREEEITELKRTLSATRLLTLIGAEGIGKSRLAIRLASDLRSGFPDGVWFAELPSLSDVDIVPGAVAWALNTPSATPKTSLADSLIAQLRDRKALLVLDGSERNLAACARLVTALLGQCPGVKCVVCARMGLGLPSEAIYCVPALGSYGVEGDSEAERLCRDRAAQLSLPVLDGFALTELCSLLNRIPLALELALGSLVSDPNRSCDDLLRSIRDLTEGQQRSYEQTLHLALDYAYQQLPAPERTLLERLSVFQSGWSLEAAGAVCCDEMMAVDLLPELLESLRKRAFIVTEVRAGFTRERLSEAVRNEAEARFTVRGEAAEVRRRHAEYFLQLAAQGALGLTGSEQEGWKAYLEPEYLNFRVALVCLRHDGEGDDREVRLATALLPMFECNGRIGEGTAILARATEAQRAAAAGSEDYATTVSRFITAIDHCQTAGDRATEVKYLHSLARIALSHADFPTARGCYEQALEVFRTTGDEVQQARTLHCLGSAARDGGEYRLANDYYNRALEWNRSLGRRVDEAHNLNGLARLALLQANNTEAARRFQEGLVIFQELGESAWVAHNRGQILRLSLPNEPLWERSPMHAGARS